MKLYNNIKIIFYLCFLILCSNTAIYSNNQRSYSFLAPETTIVTDWGSGISDIWKDLFNNQRWYGDVLIEGWKRIIEICNGDIKYLKEMSFDELAKELGAVEIDEEELIKNKAPSFLYVDNVSLKIYYCKKRIKDFEQKHFVKIGKSALIHELFEKVIMEYLTSCEFYEGYYFESEVDKLVSNEINHGSFEVLRNEFMFTLLLDSFDETKSFETRSNIDLALLYKKKSETINSDVKKIISSLIDELTTFKESMNSPFKYQKAKFLWSIISQSINDSYLSGYISFRDLFDTESDIPYVALKDIEKPDNRKIGYFKDGDLVVLKTPHNQGFPLYRGIVLKTDEQSQMIEIATVSPNGFLGNHINVSLYSSNLWKWDHSKFKFYLYSDSFRNDLVLKNVIYSIDLLVKLDRKRLLLLSQVERLTFNELKENYGFLPKEITELRTVLKDIYEKQSVFKDDSYLKLPIFRENREEKDFFQNSRDIYVRLLCGGEFRQNYDSIQEKIDAFFQFNEEFKLSNNEISFLIDIQKKYGLIALAILIVQEKEPSREVISFILDLLINKITNPFNNPSLSQTNNLLRKKQLYLLSA